MDFSSIPRVLESLNRRRPPLDEKFLQSAAELSQTSDSAVFLASLEELVTYQSSESSSGKERWEPLAVGLYIATEVLQEQEKTANKADDQEAEEKTKQKEGTAVYMEGPRVPSTIASSGASSMQTAFRIPALTAEQCLQLCQTLHVAAMKHLEHDEPRIRTLVAKAVGAYAQVSLQQQSSEHAAENMRHEMHNRLISSIHEHIQAGRDDAEKYSQSSTGALDDTTGWRALETNWQCLAALISALGSDFLTEFLLSDELLQDCQYSCVTHVNRHVRAAGMAVLEQLVVAAAAAKEHEALLLSGGSLRATVAAVLKAGLADNWSQVRMAASVLCRVFLQALLTLGSPLKDLYPALLPRMCLNRFYLAQGVKLYSHETWSMIFPETGLPLVAEYLPAICRYYAKMCDADNHVVREAACQAVAELAVRLGEHADYHDSLLPHIDLLLQVLLMCFHDESWPVRDEACLACGILCKSYPEECRPELKTLWERWTEQLTDQIWSVREDAAVALGDALEAYGPEFLTQIRELIAKILPSAKDQPAMTPAEYKARQNDVEAHTDSQLYSCGSLAPKLRKAGAGRIGCSSCGVTRPKSPWEATDGCIYLIRELCVKCTAEDSTTPMTDQELVPLLQELADVCRVQHFPQSDDLRATLWRQLPVMARAIGKQRWKRLYLEIFMDLLFSNLESRTASQLSKHAAGQCAEELADLVGTAIFRGRLDDYQQETFDRIVQERKMMPKGPSDDAFSPFGPPGLLDNVGQTQTGMHPGVGAGRFP